MIVAYTPGRPIRYRQGTLHKVLWASPRIVVEALANGEAYNTDWLYISTHYTNLE